MREARPGIARARPPAVERRDRQAHLRKRLEGSLGHVGQPLQNAAERVSPQPARSQRAENHGRANGAILLRRGLKAPRRLRRPQPLTVVFPYLSNPAENSIIVEGRGFASWVVGRGLWV